jgi:hypothetical protein
MTSILTPNDTAALFQLLSKPEVIDGFPDFFAAITSIDPEDIETLKGISKKFHPVSGKQYKHLFIQRCKRMQQAVLSRSCVTKLNQELN